MLRSICRALNNDQHLMVEAGTGTGKSFAYLIPAAMWGMQNGLRVVISTNTINLQDQLIKKDIPDLCAALNVDLRAAVLKGRSNYLCPRRLDSFRQRGPDNAEEMRILAKVWSGSMKAAAATATRLISMDRSSAKYGCGFRLKMKAAKQKPAWCAPAVAAHFIMHARRHSRRML
jgi:Rad3-related DNA helicase